MTYVHPTLIVYLRYHVATHEWGLCSQAADIQDAHDAFLHTVPMLIAKTVPVNYVTIGPRNPPFITPLVKTLLSKRRRLRKSGRIDEANVLAERINLIISETRSKQLAKLSDAIIPNSYGRLLGEPIKLVLVR